MADIFQEDFFTRITNVHWRTANGAIFVLVALPGGDKKTSIIVSEDGFTWQSLGQLGFLEGGSASSAAFGGGVFLVAGSYADGTGSGGDLGNEGGLLLSSTDGLSWNTAAIRAGVEAPGVAFDDVFYDINVFRYTDFSFDARVQKTINAGADGLDDPTIWNSGTQGVGGFDGMKYKKITPVGPLNNRVTLIPGTGFRVEQIVGGNHRTLFSSIPVNNGAQFLCYGGRGKENVFISTGWLGAFDDPVTKVFASRDGLSWEPVFDVSSQSFNVTFLVAGVPKSLRKTP